MKGVTLRLAVLASLAFVLSPPVCADEADRGEAPQRGLHAKIEYCKICHGFSGQGYRGFIPIPRLAGQQTEYFENQLRAYAERRRENRYMYAVARTLSPATRSALAAHFRGLNAGPWGGAPRHLVAAGRRLYEEGAPETNVPACMACHGADAKGVDAIPRLAGQLPDYIANKLVNWGRERGQDSATPDPSAVMLPTSHNLTRSQIAAVAAYLSYQQ
ncbi:MAG TPA: c-type cytochrome [Xanthobacteraceae bacterium]|nr:c-type cytochrome [Xanthobacteraceae bacterium]